MRIVDGLGGLWIVFEVCGWSMRFADSLGGLRIV